MGIYAICLFFGCQIWLTKSAQGKKIQEVQQLTYHLHYIKYYK